MTWYFGFEVNWPSASGAWTVVTTLIAPVSRALLRAVAVSYTHLTLPTSDLV